MLRHLGGVAAVSRTRLLAVQAQPLLGTGAALAAAAAAPDLGRGLPAGHQQARSCLTHHHSSRPHGAASGADPLSNLAATPLPLVRSDANTAGGGEPPASPYAEIFGGLWQHGEPRHILFSDDHASITNEVEKLLLVADEVGGHEAVFKVVEQFGEGPDWSGMNVATAFHRLGDKAARMSESAVESQILGHPCFHRLVAAANSKIAIMSHAELAELGRACASLRYGNAVLATHVIPV